MYLVQIILIKLNKKSALITSALVMCSVVIMGKFVAS